VRESAPSLRQFYFCLRSYFLFGCAFQEFEKFCMASYPKKKGIDYQDKSKRSAHGVNRRLAYKAPTTLKMSQQQASRQAEVIGKNIEQGLRGTIQGIPYNPTRAKGQYSSILSVQVSLSFSLSLSLSLISPSLSPSLCGSQFFMEAPYETLCTFNLKARRPSDNRPCNAARLSMPVKTSL